MEIVNWIEYEQKDRWNQPNLVAYALIEAMSNHGNQDLEAFTKDGGFDSKALQVEFKVNGIEVSFVSVMEAIQKAVEEIESDCRKVMHREAAKDIMQLLENKYQTWED